jgi:oligopeptide transport system ATP-binding protein
MSVENVSTNGQPKTSTVLRVADVRKTYNVGGGILPGARGAQVLRALDGVDLELRRGEVLALVGESGSGKSTLAKILVGSVTPTSGSVEHEEREPLAHEHGRARRGVQMVFQDPYSSLNPRMTVGAVLGELLRLHRIVPRREVRTESIRLLNLVGLEEDALDAYPSQFSGGQRQRLAIARALAVRPDVLIADEPVSALDVSVQATILDVFRSLQRELGLSILFIAHNLAVVQHLSQRVAVMYLGRIVEVADTAELFANPRHPYTRALIDSIPRMSTESVNDVFEVEGEPPSPIDIPSGCRFHPRCPVAIDRCTTDDPRLLPIPREAREPEDAGAPRLLALTPVPLSPVSLSPAHESACLRADELGPYPYTPQALEVP